MIRLGVRLAQVSALLLILAGSGHTQVGGAMVDAYALPNGGSIVGTIYSEGGRYVASLTYIDNQGQSHQWAEPLMAITPPMRASMGACGNAVHIWVEFAGDQKPVIEHVFWNFQEDLGICTLQRIYIPITNKENTND